MKNHVVRFVVLALTAAPFARAQDSPKATGEVRAVRDDGWKTASPDALGVDPGRLAAMTAAVRAWPELGVHAILIERDGRLIYEEYFDGFDERWGQPIGRVHMTRDALHDLRSITKSVTGALAGLALASGDIKSLDQPVVEWFPEYPELDTAERRRLTLAHLLTMTSGLEWNENVPYSDPRNDEVRMINDPAPLRFVLSRPFAAEPGSVFNYNGGLTQATAAIIERATKTPIKEYARKKLFEPLGVTEFEWLGDLAGTPSAASGLRLRARDAAKFGSLYLHGGQWNGNAILPADWVRVSTRPHIRFPSRAGAAGGESGYGYFWWTLQPPKDAAPLEVFSALGNGQQRIFVLPELKMVVTLYAGRYNDFASGSTLGGRILFGHVVPAVRRPDARDR